jgi:hypothetical protein
MRGLKYKTLVLGVSEKSITTDETSLRQILGQHVYVNYPMRHEAKVVGVNTTSSVFTLDASSTDGDHTSDTRPVITETHLNDEEQGRWQEYARQIQSEYMAGRKNEIATGSGGLAIGTINTILTVLPVVKSVGIGSSGVESRQYAHTTTDYPIQLVQLQTQTVRRKPASAPIPTPHHKITASATRAFTSVAGGGIRKGIQQFSYFLRKIK